MTIPNQNIGYHLDKNIKEISVALNHEINAIINSPFKSFEVRDGYLIGSNSDGYLYAFSAESEIPIPPETPLKLFIDRQEISRGIFVSQKEFEVLVLLNNSVDDGIPVAQISTEPVFVFDKLKERLDAIIENDKKKGLHYNLEIASELLGISKYINYNYIDETEKLIEIFRKNSVSHLIPNKSQSQSIGYCTGNKLHFVWGPPGTGKTANLAQVVRILVDKNERVMVLSHTNAAVDVAMLRIAEAFNNTNDLNEGKILRIGIPSLPEARELKEILPETHIERLKPDIIELKHNLYGRMQEIHERIKSRHRHDDRSKLLKDLGQIRDKINEINKIIREETEKLIGEAKVIATTLSKLAISERIWQWQPDAIAIDEISIANFPSILAASLVARNRLLLFGDFRQLPPIYVADNQIAKRWLGRDAFEIAGIKNNIDEGLDDKRVSLLNIQYRMSPDIASVTNYFAYDGKLQSDGSIYERYEPLINKGPFKERDVHFLETHELYPSSFIESRLGSYSRVNIIHAVVTHIILDHIYRSGKINIGVISPYKAQAKLLATIRKEATKYQNITVSTVHRFQGSESDAVIFDIVDSEYQKGASNLTGKNIETALRLFNVGISRSRAKLFIIADASFIENKHPRYSPARRLLNLVEKYGEKHELDLNKLKRLNNKSSKIKLLNWKELQVQLIEDLRYVRYKIVLNIPQGFVINDNLVDAIVNISIPHKQIVIFAPIEVARKFEDTEIDIRLMNLAGGFLAILDKQITYAGGHNSNGVFIKYNSQDFTKTIEELAIGSFLHRPSPRAEYTEKLLYLFGRCKECGEQRNLIKLRGIQWMIQCKNDNHSYDLLTVELLQEILNIGEVKCPDCGENAIARKSNNVLFIGCKYYKRKCKGKLPKIDELF